jgi:hypothetical protein
MPGTGARVSCRMKPWRRNFPSTIGPISFLTSHPAGFG